jgi:hypothetical protein
MAESAGYKRETREKSYGDIHFFGCPAVVAVTSWTAYDVASAR